MTPDEKSRLILRALSGEHLHDWLPGNDHKAAISHAVGTHHEWSGPEECGRVTKRGIETFDSIDAMFGGSPTLVIPWREVLEIVGRGCHDGRREAYETAYAGWNEHHRRYPSWAPGVSRTHQQMIERQAELGPVTDALHSTRDAIVMAGCEREPVQPELF